MSQKILFQVTASAAPTLEFSRAQKSEFRGFRVVLNWPSPESWATTPQAQLCRTGGHTPRCSRSGPNSHSLLSRTSNMQPEVATQSKVCARPPLASLCFKRLTFEHASNWMWCKLASATQVLRVLEDEPRISRRSLAVRLKRYAEFKAPGHDAGSVERVRGRASSVSCVSATPCDGARKGHDRQPTSFLALHPHFDPVSWQRDLCLVERG